MDFSKSLKNDWINKLKQQNIYFFFFKVVLKITSQLICWVTNYSYNAVTELLTNDFLKVNNILPVFMT